MPYNHGIRVSENPTSLAAPVEATAGLQVVFGTAPINEADKTNVNKLVLVNSFAEAVEQFGYSEDFTSYTLCQAMYAAFKLYNVKPIILCNVLDPTKATHKEAVASASYAVTAKQAIVNVVGVIADSDLSVVNGEETLVIGTDFTVSFDENHYMVVTLLDTAKTAGATSLTISGNKVKPSGVVASDVVGGVDVSTGAESGIELVRQVFPKFGLVPGFLSAPGWSHNATVAAALCSKTTSINGKFKAMALIDIETTTTTIYTAVATAKATLGVTSENAILLWPMIKTADGKKLAYSAVYGSMCAKVDAENDDVPNLSPSNKLLGIGGSCLASGTEVILDEVQANVLNQNGVVTAINQVGWRTWGNNTACYPSVTDPKDRWICCRRFFTWWENSFILTYMDKVDELANYKLIESIVDSENIRGNSYVAQGKVAGLHMEFSIEDNPVTDIINGKIKFKTYLAPYTPAEDILNEFEFDPDMITEALA